MNLVSKVWLMSMAVCVLPMPPAHPCPPDLPTLAQELLPDLPSYLNRTYTRIGIRDRFIISASRPEFVPLPVVSELPTQPHPQQLFLTVLEKKIGSHPPTPRYYWLFLSPTRQRWQLAMAYSRLGSAPPTDVSDGAIALAVRTWLRDKCFNPD